MEIKVYSTSTCPYCTMAKDFLKDNNVEFADIDVSEDATARDHMVEKSGQMGVPVIEITDGEDEHFVVGFDKEKLKELLKI